MNEGLSRSPSNMWPGYWCLSFRLLTTVIAFRISTAWQCNTRLVEASIRRKNIGCMHNCPGSEPSCFFYASDS